MLDHWSLMFSQLSLTGLDRRSGFAAIGVDVGGTKTALGLMDASGLTLLDTTVIPTGRERGGRAVLDDIRAGVSDLAGLAAGRGLAVTGIGLVVPEVVGLAGQICSAAVMPEWDQLPVAQVLSEVAPVVVEADVRAAAFAEAVLGAGQGYDYQVFLTLGTGISYTAVYQGRPIAGSRGGALNVGTSVLAMLPEGCGQPREIVLERLASGGALVQRYVSRGGSASGVPDVLAAAERGDQAAADVLREGALALGLGVALLVNMLDPEAVIVGGGLGSADTPYWPQAERYARQYLHNFAAGTVMVRSALGPDAGVIGAGLVGLCQAPQ
jgi:glucokinase